MKADLLNILILSAAFLALFGIAELLYWKAGIRAEYSRKFVHIGSGLLSMLFPVMLESVYSVGLLCASFLVLLLLSQRYKFLPSVNAIDRVSVGSATFPIAVFLCALVFYSSSQIIYYYLPLIVMAVCDPLAALVGKNWTWGRYRVWDEYKSLSGSLAFAVVAFLLSYCFLAGLNYKGPVPVVSFIVAIVSTVFEGISRKGMDNFWIPVSVLACLRLLINLEWISL